MSWDMYDMTQKVQVVVVAIVLPLVILAVSLWHDWVEEGQSPRARKIMKAVYMRFQKHLHLMDKNCQDIGLVSMKSQNRQMIRSKLLLIRMFKRLQYLQIMLLQIRIIKFWLTGN